MLPAFVDARRSVAVIEVDGPGARRSECLYIKSCAIRFRGLLEKAATPTSGTQVMRGQEITHRTLFCEEPRPDLGGST